MTFVVLEGIDGAGKTTVADALRRHFEALGQDPLILREPGSTPLGERVRHTLLDSTVGSLEPWTEVCLFVACRTELVEHQVRPALAAGRPVVLDRYFYSTIAYQGDAGGLDRGLVVELNLAAVGGLRPDLVLLLDLPVELSIARRGEAEDRIEAKGSGYLQRVRESFLRQAGEDPGRWRLLDARVDPERVARAAVEALRELGA